MPICTGAAQAIAVSVDESFLYEEARQLLALVNDATEWSAVPQAAAGGRTIEASI